MGTFPHMFASLFGQTLQSRTSINFLLTPTVVLLWIVGLRIRLPKIRNNGRMVDRHALEMAVASSTVLQFTTPANSSKNNEIL